LIGLAYGAGGRGAVEGPWGRRAVGPWGRGGAVGTRVGAVGPPPWVPWAHGAQGANKKRLGGMEVRYETGAGLTNQSSDLTLLAACRVFAA